MRVEEDGAGHTSPLRAPRGPCSSRCLTLLPILFLERALSSLLRNLSSLQLVSCMQPLNFRTVWSALPASNAVCEPSPPVLRPSVLVSSTQSSWPS